LLTTGADPVLARAVALVGIADPPQAAGVASAPLATAMTLVSGEIASPVATLVAEVGVLLAEASVFHHDGAGSRSLDTIVETVVTEGSLGNAMAHVSSSCISR